MVRSPCCKNEGLKKGSWTTEEDQKLIAYVKQHGQGNWRSLPAKAGLQRCGKSCRLRWINYLKPDIKRGKFSLQEDRTIVQLHALLGNKWSIIAAHLPKRTDNEIKNYWNTRLKKRLMKMGIDPITHKPKTNDLGHLSHMVQWESARLEAEARLLSLSHSNHHTHTRLAIAKIPLPPSLPPCLYILKAWQQQTSPSSSSSPHSNKGLHSLYPVMLPHALLHSPQTNHNTLPIMMSANHDHNNGVFINNMHTSAYDGNNNGNGYGPNPRQINPMKPQGEDIMVAVEAAFRSSSSSVPESGNDNNNNNNNNMDGNDDDDLYNEKLLADEMIIGDGGSKDLDFDYWNTLLELDNNSPAAAPSSLFSF